VTGPTADRPGRPTVAGVGTLAVEAGLLLDTLASRLADLRQRTSDSGSAADGRPVAADHRPGPDRAADSHPGPVDGAPAGSAQSESASPASPSPGPNCLAWCPVCRGAELLNGDRAQLAAQLLDTAALLVGTLRALIPDTLLPDAGHHHHSNVPAAEGPGDNWGVRNGSGGDHRADNDSGADSGTHFGTDSGAGPGAGTAAGVQRIEIR